MRRIALIAAILAFFASMPQAAIAESTRGSVVLDPQTVAIGLTFTGVTVMVRAEVPAGYEAVLRLMGGPERHELKKLGKKAGLLWMGAGNLTLEGVPAVYQVLTSAPLAEIGSPAALAQWTLGYAFLIPKRALTAELRTDFVRLREHDGFFAMHERALYWEEPAAAPHSSRLAAAEAADDQSPSPINTPRLLHGTLELPPCIPAGNYAVDLIGFRNHQATHLARTVLHLEYAGAVKQLRSFAIDHGLAYGITAALIAIGVGLLTGLLFRTKSDEAH